MGADESTTQLILSAVTCELSNLARLDQAHNSVLPRLFPKAMADCSRLLGFVCADPLVYLPADNRILLLGVIGILAQHWLHYVDLFTIVWIVAVLV